jgi:uncharacterized protein YaeQ
VYSFSSTTATWWASVTNKLSRVNNLVVWQFPAEQTEALGKLAQRSINLQITLQEGTYWIGQEESSVELTPVCLYGSSD